MKNTTNMYNSLILFPELVLNIVHVGNFVSWQLKFPTFNWAPYLLLGDFEWIFFPDKGRCTSARPNRNSDIRTDF